MINNDESRRAIAKGFRKLFNDQLARVAAVYATLAMVVKSNSSSEKYVWTEDLGGMDPWVGDRTRQNFKDHGFEIVNRMWQRTVEVPLEAIQDDKLGTLKPKIENLAASRARHFDALVFALINNGTVGLSYDSVPFFSTLHESGSNLTTAALDSTAYNAAWLAMLSQVGDDGEPLDITPTHLLVGPQNRSAAKTIVKAQTIGGTTNVDQDEVQVIVSPRITGTGWGLFDLSQPVKPIIVQDRHVSEPGFIGDNLDNPPTPFLSFGFWSRHNAGYGLHQLAHWSTGAGA